MKKLISLVTLVAVIASFSLCAFAEDVTITLPEGELTELTATDGVYTVEAESTGDYATILAVKGKTIKVGAIQYINQDVTADGKATFSFALNDDLLTADATNTATEVYVLTGGDGETTVHGYIQTKAEDPEPEVKYFTIAGTVTGFAGSTLPTVTVTDGTNNYTALVNADGAFEVSVPVLAEGSYTLTATKTSHLSYTMAQIVGEADATVTVNPVVKGGDMNADKLADVFDMTLIVNNYGAQPTAESPVYTEAYDVNEDSIMDVFDMTIVVNNYGAGPISLPVVGE